MSETLFRWINRELNTRNWSMKELARRSDMESSTFSKVLSGKRNPTLLFYQSVSQAFNEPLENILRLAGVLPATNESNENQTDQLIFSEFLDIAKRLTPEQRLDVLHYADYLLYKKKFPPSSPSKTQ